MKSMAVPGRCVVRYAACAAVLVACLLAMCAFAGRGGRADSPSMGQSDAAGWVNVTNNVGGDRWGAYGVTYMKAVPRSHKVIAGVSERGLWMTEDDGATWKKLGGDEIKNRPGRIVFDPKNSDVFWESGCYGDAPFKTENGGKTFTRLGALAHADGIAVDFTDRKRRTLLLGMHEQERSLQMSTDAGQSWTKIGDRLPEDTNHSTDPIILDSKTFLINTAGWKQNATMGIYRSEDAGATWSRVSSFGPSGEPLVTSDGTIYWDRIWGGSLLKSTDRGKTWAAVPHGVRSNLIEMPRKRVAGLDGDQIVVSNDAGATWTKAGPPVPFKPNGITYSDKGKCFFAWRLSDNMNREAMSIVRLYMD
jgi:hypothetical protein